MEQCCIENINLWDKIKDTIERDSSWGWKKVADEKYLYCCRFEKGWVTDIISREDARNIKPYTPVFVVSQTGTGKTTFLFRNCLPVAIEERKKVLYISNRVSLTEQMKQRCMEDELNGIQKVDGIQVKDMKDYHTDKFITEATNFGGVEVYSYHGLLRHFRQMDFSKYAFVIMDEAHFFFSDATFNVYTEVILEIILENCLNIRRIYLTATPQESITDVYEKEMMFMNKSLNMYMKTRICDVPRMKVYVVDEDYAYIRPYFFHSSSFIIERIKQSSEDDFWMIFVRDITTGETIKEELKGNEGGIEFITASSDKTAESYRDLISNERLPRRVLISTKVLDVGVNIKTENLHMVIFEDNVVELKQMIGRKRVKEGEYLDVYFHIPNFKQLVQRKGQIEIKLAEETKLAQTIGGWNSSFSKYLHHPLYYHNGIKLNKFSIKKLQKDRAAYKKFIEKLERYQRNESEYMKQYAKLLLEKFQGKLFLEEMLLELNYNDAAKNNLKTEVDEFVKTWIGKTFQKEELEHFSEELTTVIGDCRKAKRVDRGVMGIQTIKAELNKYGYMIESLKTTPVSYKITIFEKEEV